MSTRVPPTDLLKSFMCSKVDGSTALGFAMGFSVSGSVCERPKRHFRPDGQVCNRAAGVESGRQGKNTLANKKATSSLLVTQSRNGPNPLGTKTAQDTVARSIVDNPRALV